jgi:hypothetical protein
VKRAQNMRVIYRVVGDEICNVRNFFSRFFGALTVKNS